MTNLDQLLTDLSRVANVCNEFAEPDLQKAAFNILTAAMALPTRPERMPIGRDHAATEIIPVVR